MKKPIPKIGETYNCFDDRKIRESRLYTVKVTEVLLPEDVDAETILQWKEDVINCTWLYAPKTDYFVKALNNDSNDTEVFVRTKRGEWFSIGYLHGGVLDVDGELIKRM